MNRSGRNSPARTLPCSSSRRSNALIQEQSLDIHYNQGNDLLDYVTDASAFEYEDGYVELPDGPGLGIEVDEEYVRERAETDVDWHNPVWEHPDGSVAEW